MEGNLSNFSFCLMLIALETLICLKNFSLNKLFCLYFLSRILCMSLAFTPFLPPTSPSNLSCIPQFLIKFTPFYSVKIIVTHTDTHICVRENTKILSFNQSAKFIN